MSDNTTLNSGTGGDVIATDDIAGVKVQRVKIMLGADGVNDGDVASGNALPISDNGGSLTVDAVSLPLPTGAATSAKQDLLLTELQLKADLTETQPVSVASLPLPSGAATSALQSTQDASINTLLKPASTLAAVTTVGTVSTITNVVHVDDNAGSLTVDGTFWQATQPISAAALPLPSGASTSALQTTGNSSVASIDTKTPALGQALAATSVPVVLTAAQLSTLTPVTGLTDAQLRATAVPVSGTFFQGTQPVSIAATVTVDTELPAAAALADAVVNPTVPTVGSAILGFNGTTFDRLRTTGTGVLKVDLTGHTANAVAVKTDSSATTQPISAASLPLPSGAATSALQTTQDTSINTLLKPASTLAAVTTVSTVTNLSQLGGAAIAMNTGVRSAGTQRVTVATDDLVPISVASLPLPSGAATSALQSSTSSTLDASINTLLKPANTLAAVTSLTQMNGQAIAMGTGVRSAGTQRVTVATDDVVPVTGTFFQGTQPISAASLPLPAGAATEASLVKLPLAQASTTAGQSGTLIQGAVTTAAPTYTTAQTSPLSLTTTGLLRTDSSGVTQPVSAASLPLPTGAATSALQSTQDTSINSLLKPASTLAAVTTVGTVSAVTSITNALPTGANTIGYVNPDITVSGNITASNAAPTGVATANSTVASGDLHNISNVGIFYNGTFSASNISVYATIDNVVWEQVTTRVVSSGNAYVTNITASAYHQLNVAGFRQIRVNCGSYTSGTVNVTIRLSSAASQQDGDKPIRLASIGAGNTIVSGNGVTGSGSQRVTIASDNTAFSVNANAGTNLNTSALNLETTQTAMSSKLPATLGQKAMAASMAVVLASDQASIPVAATLTAETTKVIGTVNIAAAQSVTANAGTNLNTSALALDATLTGGTQKSIVRGGAKGSTTAADITSTSQSADRNAMDVQIRTSAGAVVDSFGGGTEYTVNAVAPADPVGATFVMERDDQLAALTEIEGDWTNPRATSKGAMWVAIADAAGDPLTSFGGGQQYADGAARGTATGTLMMVDDGTNLQSVSGDSTGKLNVNNISGTVSLPTGAATSALQSTIDTSVNTLLKPASTLAAVTSLTQMNGQAIAMGTGVRSAGTQRVTIATDDIVPISAASLPLPTLAATSTKQSDGSQKTQIVDGGGLVISSITPTSGVNAILVAEGGSNYLNSAGNSSVAQLAASATFTGTIESILSQKAVMVSMTSDQNGTLTLKQYIDAGGTKALPSITVSVTASVAINRSWYVAGNYFNLTFQNTGGSTTTTLNISTYYGDMPTVSDKANMGFALNEISGTALNIGQQTKALSIPIVMPNDQNLVSTSNSSTATLGISGVFTGTSEDISQYAVSRIYVFSDVASATDGLSIQKSSNGTNWDSTDVYTISANTGKTFSVSSGGRFFRIVYTNGGTAQASFRLQVIHCAFAGKGSSQRPQDARSNDNDVEEVAGFNMVYNGTSWDRTRSGASAATATLTGLQNVLAGGIYNSTAPTLTNGQTVPAQLDVNGNQRVVPLAKATYRASTIIPLVAAVTVNVPFFNIIGSATKTVTVKRITVSGMTLTAVGYFAINVEKLSTASTAGTSTTLVATTLDTNNAAVTAVVKAYTVAPTKGTLVGTLRSWRALWQSTTAAAAATTDYYNFDFGDVNGSGGVVLRGVAQELALTFPVVLASAGTLAVDIEWTEE